MTKVPVNHHGRTWYFDIDDADVPLSSEWSWCIHTNGYVQGFKGGRKDRVRVYLHRLIMAPGEGMTVDHINGNRLDNRRCNLRVCPQGLNNLNSKTRRDNTHGYRGISLHKKSGLWQARISLRGVRRDLGYFRTPQEAHVAYQAAARELHGEYRHGVVDVPST